MRYKDITSGEQLREYCRELRDARSIAFDTEFVSERTYRPVLCLVQVSADGRLAVVNIVGAEEVLKGVVPSELFASAAPQALRARVTSPGGTTERAIETMDAAGVKEALVKAVRAAAARSRELGT